MATLKEYFDTDLKRCLSHHKPWGILDADGNEIESITARISLDFNANAKYWSFYVPPSDNTRICVNTIFEFPQVRNCVLGPEGEAVQVLTGFYDYTEQASSETLMFTNRISLNCVFPVSHENIVSLS